MKTLSLDLRERIVAAYDADEGTRLDVARRFRVSLGMVKKLLQQRRATGSIAHRHRCAGRKPTIRIEHRHRIRKYLAKDSDMTLQELRAALGLKCSLPAIHYVLKDMDLTYKKRRFGPVSKTDRK
jgi:transposase